MTKDEGTVASRNISSMRSRMGKRSMLEKRPTTSKETRILPGGGENRRDLLIA